MLSGFNSCAGARKSPERPLRRYVGPLLREFHRLAGCGNHDDAAATSFAMDLASRSAFVSNDRSEQQISVALRTGRINAKIHDHFPDNLDMSPQKRPIIPPPPVGGLHPTTHVVAPAGAALVVFSRVVRGSAVVSPPLSPQPTIGQRPQIDNEPPNPLPEAIALLTHHDCLLKVAVVCAAAGPASATV